MTYTLDNASAYASTRMSVLEHLYDSPTFELLDWVDVRPGWLCWEIGAGGGSVAQNLWARGAKVIATDLDLRYMPTTLPADIVQLRHDVVADEPPGWDFDLIHLRLVASHLPEWPQVLPRLIEALRPGGWLLVEELDPMTPYQPAQRTDTDRLVNLIGDRFTEVLASRGGDPRLGRRLRRQLTAAGLEDVTSSGLVVEARGGEPAAQLMQANVAQTAPRLRELGVSVQELLMFDRAMSDPDTYFVMPTFWQAAGRKP